MQIEGTTWSLGWAQRLTEPKTNVAPYCTCLYVHWENAETEGILPSEFIWMHNSHVPVCIMPYSINLLRGKKPVFSVCLWFEYFWCTFCFDNCICRICFLKNMLELGRSWAAAEEDKVTLWVVLGLLTFDNSTEVHHFVTLPGVIIKEEGIAPGEVLLLVLSYNLVCQ